MTTPGSPTWRGVGDTTAAVYITEFAREESPLLRWAEQLRGAAAPHSALCLAQMWMENQYATTGHLIRPEHHNPLGLRPGPGITVPHGTITVPGGSQFLTFETPVDCVREWRRRITDPGYRVEQYPGGAYAGVTTLAQYLARYAPAGDVHPVTGLDNVDTDYLVTVQTMLYRYAAQEGPGAVAPPTEGTDMPVTFTDALKAKKVLINAGHRNYSKGGARGEWGWTDDAALALAKAFRAIGWTADILQEVDGDADQDDLLGHLDRVGQVATSLDKTRGPYCFFLSQHHDGGPGPGMFCIPPGSGSSPEEQLIPYRTRVFDGEYLAGNAGDLRLSREISAGVAASTRLGFRTSNVIEPGVMAEWQTGVGGDGWRLSELFETLPMRAHAARLILEAGSIDSADGAFIHTAAFLAAYAPAVAAATERWRRDELARAGTPDTAPAPVPVPTPPPAESYGPGMDRGIAERMFGRVVDDTGVYEFDPAGPVSRAWLERGREGTGTWPALAEVWHYEDRRYFRFADGFTLMASDGKLIQVG